MKKFIKLLAVALAITFTVSVGVVNTKVTAKTDLVIQKIHGNDYVRTFYDEFSGKTLDTTKWSLCPESSRQGGYCKWSNSMTSLDGNGHLVLTANYDENDNLLCGAIRSRSIFEQKYGYFEIRAKLQNIEGIWSAFWLMPINIDLYGQDGGADGTEIDIFEAFNVKNNKINHAIHYDGYASRHKSYGKSVVANVYDGEYHHFSLEWNEDMYIFYIDGKETYRITTEAKDSTGANIQISKIQSYMIISLESGSWTGKPAKGDVPASLLVDYVKVYQRADRMINSRVIYGDLDKNIDINQNDVLLYQQYLSKQNDSINKLNADVNCDGNVDLKDVLIVKKYLADIYNSLPQKGSWNK